jgi:hypothetical protein
MACIDLREFMEKYHAREKFFSRGITSLVVSKRDLNRPRKFYGVSFAKRFGCNYILCLKKIFPEKIPPSRPFLHRGANDARPIDTKRRIIYYHNVS